MIFSPGSNTHLQTHTHTQFSQEKETHSLQKNEAEPHDEVDKFVSATANKDVLRVKTRVMSECVTKSAALRVRIDVRELHVA